MVIEWYCEDDSINVSSLYITTDCLNTIINDKDDNDQR